MVRMLEEAISDFSGEGELRVHGTEATCVVLTGVVESLVRHATGLEFTLNDTTGRIRVRYFVSNPQDMECVVCGRYVALVGAARTNPSAHISAQAVRAVVSADEVSYHAIEAAHAALSLRKSSSVPALMATPVRSRPTAEAASPGKEALSPPKELAPSAPPVVSPLAMSAATSIAEPAQPACPAPLAAGDVRKRVLDSIQKADGEEGLALSSLLQSLEPCSHEEVRKCLDQLVADGDIFHTIDEEHFAPL